MNLEKKRQNEIDLIYEMISIYCKKKYKEDMCEECMKLYEYAKQRIEKCPMMETKTFCSQCKIHCYQKEQREKIKKVMRFSGPRLIFHHPILVIRHGIESWKGKKQV